MADGLHRYGVDAPDIAIDCAGKAVVRDECMALLGPRGVLVSVAHGEGLTIKDLYSDFVAREMTLIASEYFAFRELEANHALLLANRAYLEQIITHRLGVGDIQHAFEQFFNGRTGKVVIEQ